MRKSLKTLGLAMKTHISQNYNNKTNKRKMCVTRFDTRTISNEAIPTHSWHRQNSVPGQPLVGPGCHGMARVPKQTRNAAVVHKANKAPARHRNWLNRPTD